VVENPTSGFVLTSNVCLNCPMEISGRAFLIDLICLPLRQIDVDKRTIRIGLKTCIKGKELDPNRNLSVEPKLSKGA